MEKFVDSIKEKYRERLINREKQWPPCHSNKLLNLELVERRKGESYLGNQPRGKRTENAKRTPLPYNQLFEGKKRIRRVLVEGDAGIGKTTLSVSISEDWANGELFQQFELVLLLPLRLKEVGLAGSLSKLLKLLHSSNKNCDAVVNYLDEEEGKKVLIIADGWDELRESDQEENSFMFKLLFQTFPFLSVIVTSRPSCSAQLHQLPYIDRFVEILGFDKEKIREYIQSEFTDDQAKADYLIRQLESNPLVASVCSIPISCAIVCHLWRVTEETLPASLTQLYTKIILNIILRNIRKIDKFKDIINIPSFVDIPADLKESFWLLCKFALHAMQKDQIVFSQRELDSFSQDLVSNKTIFNCFGLLQSADSVVETGCETSFHFLHLTIQEYLAALYLVKELSGVKLADCETVIRELKLYKLYKHSGRFSIVWRFLFGIFFCSEIQGNNDLFVQLYLKLTSEIIYFEDLILYHCAFEAKHESIIRPLSEELYVTPILPETAHDCDAILYVIKNMQKHNALKIVFHNCGVNENQIKALTSSLADKQGELQVNLLNMSGNNLMDKVVMNLVRKASAAFSSLQYLYLGNNQIGAETIQSIAVSSVNGLSSLDLSHNPLGIPGLQALGDAVCCNVLTTLESLNLQGSLSNDETTDQAFIEALSCNCPLLTELDVSKNNLSLLSIVMALAGFVSSRSQVSLTLSETRLGDSGLNSFIKHLRHPCYFTRLKLDGNDILDSSVSHSLTVAICSGVVNMIPRSLPISDWGICLDDNPLGLEGTIAIGRILSSEHYRNERLSLSRCQLTIIINSSDVESINFQISQFLDDSDKTQTSNVLINTGKYLTRVSQNNCVTDLCLDGNNFSGEEIHILAGFLHLCPQLTTLSSEDCGITSDDLQNLIKQLQITKPSLFLSPCSNLELWSLNNNSIDDRGILLLIDHLSPLFPQLGAGGTGGLFFDWSFSGNSVTPDVVKRFKEESYEKHHVSIAQL